MRIIASLVRRWASPIQLGAAAVLFCLPWMRVQCNYEFRNGMPGRDEVARQSGVQAALGTTVNNVKDLQSLQESGERRTQESVLSPSPAWYVAGSGILLLAGLATGIYARGRPIFVAGCVTASLLLLIGQSVVGFPIANQLPAENIHLREAYERRKENASTNGPPVLTLEYGWPFYGTFGLLTTAAMTALLQCWQAEKGEKNQLCG